MSTPSLLDWLTAHLARPHTQRDGRLALALGLSALAFYIFWGDALCGGTLFSLAASAWAWALRVRVPTETLSHPENESSALARWGAWGALGLTLAGQYVLSLRQAPWLGAALLFAGAGAWAHLTHHPPSESGPPQTPTPTLLGVTFIRWPAWVIGIGLSLITFFATADNHFSLLGRLTWAGSLVAMLVAFWEGAWPRWSGRLTFSRTALALLGVLALSATVRLAYLDSVPPEMTSDHVEKLLDVNAILNLGARPIFEPHNGGREALGFYLYALMAGPGGLGLNFFMLKFTNALIGLATLPLIFGLARELTEDDLTALFATLAAGIAWWPNSLSRNGLRFPLAPFFATLTVWLLVRGLRRRNRNSVLLAGTALGVGLYGYTAFRIVPLLVIVILAVYALWPRWRAARHLIRVEAATHLALIALLSLTAFVPLLRYALDAPREFWYRSLTRLSGDPNDPRAPTPQILVENIWNAAHMFNWTHDAAWLVSPAHQPALDGVMGALFVGGWLMAAARAWRKRDWRWAMLVVSVPVAIIPSTLALAYPIENPSLHRASVAIPFVFILVAVALRAVVELTPRRWLGAGVVGALLLVSFRANWNILFVDYPASYLRAAQNASDLGRVIADFAHSGGTHATAHVQPYPYWVDTRAVGIYAGNFGYDYALLPGELDLIASDLRPQLFLVNLQDADTLNLLETRFPAGSATRFSARRPDLDFWIYRVPAAGAVLENPPDPLGP